MIFQRLLHWFANGFLKLVRVDSLERVLSLEVILKPGRSRVWLGAPIILRLAIIDYELVVGLVTSLPIIDFPNLELGSRRTTISTHSATQVLLRSPYQITLDVLRAKAIVINRPKGLQLLSCWLLSWFFFFLEWLKHV